MHIASLGYLQVQKIGYVHLQQVQIASPICSTETVSERQDVSLKLKMLDAQGASDKTDGITSLVMSPLFPTGSVRLMLFISIMFPFKQCDTQDVLW